MRGRGLFRAASVGLLLVGVLHMIGHLARVASGPSSEAERAVVLAMESFHTEIWGMQPSMLDAQRTLSLYFGLFGLWVALQSLLLARFADARALRAASALAVVFVAALAAVAGYYRVAPPLLMLSAVLVLFVGVLLRARPGEGARAARVAE